MSKLEWRYFSAGRTTGYSRRDTPKVYSKNFRTFSTEQLTEPVREIESKYDEEIVALFDNLAPGLSSKIMRKAANPLRSGALTTAVQRLAMSIAVNQMWKSEKERLWVHVASNVGIFYRNILKVLLKRGTASMGNRVSPEEAAFFMTRQFLSMILSNFITIIIASDEDIPVDEDDPEIKTPEDKAVAMRDPWSRVRVALILHRIFPDIVKYRTALSMFFKYVVNRNETQGFNRNLFLRGEAIYSMMLTKLTQLIVEGAAANLDIPEAQLDILEEVEAELQREDEDEMETSDNNLEQVREPELTFSRRRRRTEDRKSYRKEYYSGGDEYDLDDEESRVDKEFSRLFSRIRISERARINGKMFAKMARRRGLRTEREIFSALRNYLLRNFSRYFASDEEAEEVVDDVVVVLQKAKAQELVEDIQDLAQKATQLILDEVEPVKNEEKMTVDTSEYEEGEDYGYEEEGMEGYEYEEEGEEEGETEEGEEAEEEGEEGEEESEEEEEEEEKAESRRRSRHSRRGPRRYSFGRRYSGYVDYEDEEGYEDYEDEYMEDEGLDYGEEGYDDYEEEGYDDYEDSGEEFVDSYDEMEYDEDSYGLEEEEMVDELEDEIFAEEEEGLEQGSLEEDMGYDEGVEDEDYVDEGYMSKRSVMKHYRTRRGGQETKQNSKRYGKKR